MKRKAPTTAKNKPEQSAAQGFNNLFKKKKKEPIIETTIDLCDSDDEPALSAESTVFPLPEEPVEKGLKQLKFTDRANVTKDVVEDEEKQVEEESEKSQREASAMVTATRLILDYVLANETKRELLGALLETVRQLGTLSDSILDATLRWYRRRQGWRAKLKFVAHQALIDRELLETFNGGPDAFDENLRLLTMDELRTVAIKMNIEKKHRKTKEVLRQKMTLDYEQNTKSHFGAKSASTRLAEQVNKQLIGARFRLAPRIQRAIDTLILAYSPTLITANTAGNDGQVSGSAAIVQYSSASLGEDFFTAISRFGLDANRPLVTPNDDLLTSSAELDQLRQMLQIKYTCIQLTEAKCHEQVIAIGEENLAKFSAFRNERGLYTRHQNVVAYLRRYTITGQYIKILKYYVDALERVKNYQSANEVLRLLIDSQLAPHRHGQWWLRLIINSGHLKDQEDLIGIFESATQDRNINEPERYDIMARMVKHLPSNKALNKELTGWEVKRELAQRLSQETNELNDRKKWLHEDRFVSVEQLVLERAQTKLKLDSGAHAESALFSTILSLLLAKQILDTKVDQVYQTPFQDGPLDFFTKDFYTSRKEQINARFAQFSEEMDETLAEMEEVWESHPDGIIGMTYSLSRDNLDWDKIAAFCRCLGVTKLLQVLKRLVRTPAYRSGLPDVAVWSSKGTSGDYCMIEVKAPGDKLSFAQKCWFKFFVSKAITCHVMHVDES